MCFYAGEFDNCYNARASTDRQNFINVKHFYVGDLNNWDDARVSTRLQSFINAMSFYVGDFDAIETMRVLQLIPKVPSMSEAS